MLHGLATPNFIIPFTRIPAIAAQLSLLLMAFWLLLSTLPTDNAFSVFLAHRQRLILWLWTAWLLVLDGLALFQPRIVTWMAIDQLPTRYIIAALTAGLILLAAGRYLQAYRYSHFPLQIAIVYVSSLLLVVQWIIITGTVFRLSWWLYHFYLLAAVLILLVGLWQQYLTRQSLGSALQAIFSKDLTEQLTASLSPSLRALVIATEAKDVYTAGHNHRVAMYAMRLGKYLGLPPEDLRTLVHGGMVHDVGKIEIPDSVLNKPGRLDAQEREIIERHPITGFNMCRLLGFMNGELEVIRHHHEAWDGSGYPDQLKGHDIPFLARILAVADVYDALTSDRAYRKAMTHEDACQILLDGKGKQFDVRCIKAWMELHHLQRSQPQDQELSLSYPSPGPS
jgi:HD-GYP domain-containing protein (c-di-GMP phosphodiesterase class II)